MTSVTPKELLIGVGMDLLFNDPRSLPHPVRGLGWLIVKLEGILRGTRLPLRAAGVLLLISCLFISCTLVWLTLPWANIYWIWILLAIRGLDLEATEVVKSLDAGDIALAREKLSMIVGRDTAHLDEAEILRAAVETVAENLSDAIIGPLFYLALAGPIGMAAYKTVNTLDSMVGYRNERYREFGWASARLDDLLNLIPARLAAVLVWLCALLLRFDVRRSIEVTLRDAWRQPSPNSGYPEAAVAGALGIRLGGLNYYGGKPSKKEYIGDMILPLTPGIFRKTRHILYVASALMVAAVCGVLQ